MQKARRAHEGEGLDVSIERQLYDAAMELIRTRYPRGWGGAAALYTAGGRVLTSVAPEVINASTELCIETGAICEAHKWGDAVTHSLCVVRDNDDMPFKILSPCGACQERLWLDLCQVHTSRTMRFTRRFDTTLKWSRKIHAVMFVLRLRRYWAV